MTTPGPPTDDDPGDDPLDALESAEASLLAAAPALAKIALGAWWRTTEWTAGASVRAGARVIDAARTGESAADLLQRAGTDVRGYARQLLGLAEAMEAAAAGEAPGPGPARPGDPDSLRQRGEELLRQSADVAYEEQAHPAYRRILSDLAPDEGRILRFLTRAGSQPAVDVRTARMPMVNSELVAPGLSMIGAEAGVRYLDRVPAYLNNLYRLGLIWFSREPLPDPLTYQVLEAQPEVGEALSEAGRGGKTVRRSIHLTPFGEDFSRVCLPAEGEEVDTLPDSEAARERGEPKPPPAPSPGPPPRVDSR